MICMKRVIILAGATVTLAAASVTTPALADEIKVYSGSACQPAFEFYTDATKLTRFNGTIRNADAKTNLVNCPIVREKELSTVGFTAKVLVNNGVGFGVRLSCNISSRDALGNFLQSNAAFTDQAETRELSMTVAQSVSQGTYTLDCSLPERSSVIRYTIDEK